MSDLATVDLTGAEARALTDEVRVDAERLHSKLLRLRNGRAWLALGYDTWSSYVHAEFDMTKQHANRLVAHAEITHAIAQVEPTGSTSPIVPISEGQTRPLTKLRDDPAAVRSAWTRATDQAEATQKPVTAAVVEQAVRDELAARRGEIEAAQQQAADDRRQVDEFNDATAHLVPQAEAERPWSLAAIALTRALDALPLDVDPDELAAHVPEHSAYRLDKVTGDVLSWLSRLFTARQEKAS